MTHNSDCSRHNEPVFPMAECDCSMKQYIGKLVIDGFDFIHQKNMSSYNNNYYSHKVLGYTILERCHEDEGYYSFYLIEGNTEVFIGSSKEGFDFSSTDKMVFTIDFKQY